MEGPTKKWWRDSTGSPHTCLDWHPHRGRAHNCFSCGATPEQGVRAVDVLPPASSARRQTEASAAIEGRVIPTGFKRSAAVQEFLDGRKRTDRSTDRG